MAPILREDVAETDFSDVSTGGTIPVPTPGDVLRFEFMEPMGISAYKLSRETGMPANRITGICHNSRAITAGTALILADYFKTSPQFWMNLQTNYSLIIAQQKRVPA